MAGAYVVNVESVQGAYERVVDHARTLREHAFDRKSSSVASCSSFQREPYLLLRCQSGDDMKIQDLYPEEDLDDEIELLLSELSDDALEFEFEVRSLTHAQTARALTPIGDLTVAEAMHSLADADQWEIICHKQENFDAQRVIVMRGESVIDGNHHLMAAHLSGRGVNYIQLEDVPEPALKP